MAEKVKQGNSLWYDLTGDITKIDSVWANWSSSWAIVDVIGNIPLASGASYKTATPGHFIAQVPPVDTLGLPVGNYLLLLQVENVTMNWRDEKDPIKITITPQGII
jgi:hypothetical protein